MIFRPFKQLKQYKQLVEALNKQIEQLKTLKALTEEITVLHEQRIKWQADTIEVLKQRPQSQPVEVKMPLPTVEAVEGLVSAFFDTESVNVARDLFEVTKNYAPIGPQDVKATGITLMKLCRHHAMRKLEQAAKQDVL